MKSYKNFRSKKSKARKHGKTKKAKNLIKEYIQNGGAELNVTGENIGTFIFTNPNISLQPNTDPHYKEVGIIHVTESSAVNIVRGTVTGFANLFGAKGFDNTIYDHARNSALEKLMLVANGRKVCNLKMDVTGESELFFVHLYGSLLEPVDSSEKPIEPINIEPPHPEIVTPAPVQTNQV